MRDKPQLFREVVVQYEVFGTVFWLPGLPTIHTFPLQRSSGRIVEFVAGYSSATATDLHRLPVSLF
jgi:hypothetical protein